MTPGPPPALHDPYNDLKENRLHKWVVLRTCFAQIDEVDGRISARLCEFNDDGSTSELSAFDGP